MSIGDPSGDELGYGTTDSLPLHPETGSLPCGDKRGAALPDEGCLMGGIVDDHRVACRVVPPIDPLEAEQYAVTGKFGSHVLQ